jgi:iron complex outermembrane receptor protein
MLYGAAPSVSAQTSALAGRVTMPDGTPAVGAQVSVRGTSLTTTTDGSGSFMFRAVPLGKQVVDAVLDGHTGSRELSLSNDVGEPLEIRIDRVRLEGERVEVFGSIPKGDSGLDRLPGPASTLPLSLSVVPKERIEVQKAQSLNEVLRYTAGVQSEQYGGLDQAFDFLTIRGFGGSSFNGLFRDGARLDTFNFLGFRLEPYGAESVAVLRGAASVLYGQASPGGIINFSSKRPTIEPVRELSLEAGNFQHLQAKFDVGGPLAGGKSLRYRLTGLVRDADTQVDFQPNNRFFLAPALAWQGARTTITFLGQVQRDLTQHFQFLPQVGTAESTTFGRIPESRSDGEPEYDEFERHQSSVGYLLEHRFRSGWVLRQDTRHDRLSVVARDVYGSGLDPTDPSQRLLARSNYGVDGTSAVTTVNGQIARTFGSTSVRSTIAAGAEYQYSRFDDVESFGAAPSLDVYTPHYGQPLDPPSPFFDALTVRNQSGIFASSRLEFANGLVTMLNGRQNAVSDHIDDRLTATTSEEDVHRFVWQGGLAFRNRSNVIPHFSYSESFLPVSGVDFSGRRREPETGQQYELGLRYQPAAKPMSVAMALYDLRRQNVLTADPTNPANQVQTGEVRSRGLELEADITAGGSSITASYTWQNARVTKSNTSNLGLRPSVTPEHMASLWAHRIIRSGSLQGLGAGAGIRFQGATLDSTNTFEVDGVTLVDVMVSYQLHRLRFALNAQNLFDKEYVAGCSGGSCYYGRALTMYGSTTYAW